MLLSVNTLSNKSDISCQSLSGPHVHNFIIMIVLQNIFLFNLLSKGYPRGVVVPQTPSPHRKHRFGRHECTGYTQKNGAVSKVNKKFISHLTRAQRIPSAAATVQVSHALPAVRFSCLLRGQFPRWRRSRKRPSVCSVLRCTDL